MAAPSSRTESGEPLTSTRARPPAAISRRTISSSAAILRVSTFDPERIELRAHAFRQLEHGLGGHAVAAGADHLRRAARAAQELQRIDQQRFPGAGLARQNVQPRPRLDGELFDDGQVADFQIRDHAQ